MLNNFIRQHKILLIIILLAFLVRLLFFLAISPWPEEMARTRVVDTDGYQNLALKILDNKSLRSFDNPTRTPGYPLFLAVIYFVFGIKAWIVLAFQILIDIGTLILIYLLTKELFASVKAANWAALLYAVDLLAATFTALMLTETLFVFFLVFAIFVFIKALKKQKNILMILSGLVLGAAVLIRPAAQYLPLIMILIIFLVKDNFKNKLRQAILFLVMFFLVISPWQMYNLKKYGHYELTSIQGFYLTYSAATVKYIKEKIKFEEAFQGLEKLVAPEISNPFEKSKLQKNIALNYVKQNYWTYGLFYLKGMTNLFLGTAKTNVMDAFNLKAKYQQGKILSESLWGRIGRSLESARQEYYLTPILFGWQILEYLFLLAGAFALYQQHQKKYLLFLLLIIFYFVVVTGVAGNARFRLPIVPFYLIIGAWGITTLSNLVKNKNLDKKYDQIA